MVLVSSDVPPWSTTATGKSAKRRGRPRKSPQPKAPQTQGALIFDIETGPLPADQLDQYWDESAVKTGNLRDPAKIAEKIVEARTAFVERAALDPITGRVLAIGLQSPSGWSLCDASEESDLLIAFWQQIDAAISSQLPVVGWNVHDFDLPFLIGRSRILGVNIPAGLRHGRYWSDLITDLMKIWTLDRYGTYAKLDTVGRALGLGGKTDGIDGSQFHVLWSTDRAKAVEYLRRDVELTAAIHERIGSL